MYPATAFMNARVIEITIANGVTLRDVLRFSSSNDALDAHLTVFLVKLPSSYLRPQILLRKITLDNLSTR